MEVYLDNAATSHPKPPCVTDAVTRAMTDLNANPGRSGHRRALEGARELLRGRELLAGMLGASDPFSVTYCFNCTDALNLAIKGVLRDGDHAVASMIEHNSVLRVLEKMRALGRIDVTLVKPDPRGVVDPGDFYRALRKNTRLFVLTQASNVTGALQPVAAVGRLARDAGVRFLVDGAQAFGAEPTDVGMIGCDMYAFPGHKGLLGPQGTGGLYIAPGLALDTLREGGTGSASESMTQPGDPPERYESGTANLHGIAGMNAGAEYVAARRESILENERRLTEVLLEELRNIDGVTVYGPRVANDRAALVSFNVGDFPSGAVADSLARRDICVRGGLHCAPGAHTAMGTLSRGAVRASVGHASADADVDALLRAVREIARNGL